MSDTYEALLDCGAASDEAVALAERVVEVLVSEKLVLPQAASECVLDGVGYPPGPRCSEVYPIEERDEPFGNKFWALKTSGVQVIAEPWVNILGFTQLSEAVCPRCENDCGDDFLDAVGSHVEPFTSSGLVPDIECPACQSNSSIHRWTCDPHLGFANLAIVFWNWAAFDDPTWRINIPALLEDRLGRSLTSTYGQV